jgi:hypothetical protein
VRFATNFVQQKKSPQIRGKRHSGLPRNFFATLPRLFRLFVATNGKFEATFAATLPRIFYHIFPQYFPGILP